MLIIEGDLGLAAEKAAQIAWERRDRYINYVFGGIALIAYGIYLFYIPTEDTLLTEGRSIEFRHIIIGVALLLLVLVSKPLTIAYGTSVIRTALTDLARENQADANQNGKKNV